MRLLLANSIHDYSPGIDWSFQYSGISRNNRPLFLGIDSKEINEFIKISRGDLHEFKPFIKEVTNIVRKGLLDYARTNANLSHTFLIYNNQKTPIICVDLISLGDIQASTLAKDLTKNYRKEGKELLRIVDLIQKIQLGEYKLPEAPKPRAKKPSLNTRTRRGIIPTFPESTMDRLTRILNSHISSEDVRRPDPRPHPYFSPSYSLSDVLPEPELVDPPVLYDFRLDHDTQDYLVNSNMDYNELIRMLTTHYLPPAIEIKSRIIETGNGLVRYSVNLPYSNNRLTLNILLRLATEFTVDAIVELTGIDVGGSMYFANNSSTGATITPTGSTTS